MRGLAFVFSAGCLLAAYSLSGPATGQPSTPKGQHDNRFTLRVCNYSKVRDVGIALMTWTEQGRWRFHGWYEVLDDECYDQGSYLRPSFYFHARGGGHSWGSNNTRQCINPKRENFDRVVGFEGYRCAGRNDIAVGFGRREMSADRSIFVLNLR